MCASLADVFMNSIVRDVYTGDAVALRVDEAVVVLDVWQQRGPGLHTVFFGEPILHQRRLKDGTVCLGTIQCLRQRQS